MTISSLVRMAGPFIGSGTQTLFPFAFKVFQQTDLLVLRTDTVPSQTTLVYGTDYAVSLNGDQNTNPGGVVTLLVALASLYTLQITSNVPATQPASLTNAGGFFPRTIEDALDRMMVLYQQVTGLAGLLQTLRVPEVGGISSLGSAASRAGTLLGFDALGNPAPVAIQAPGSFTYGQSVIDKFTGDGATTVFNLSANPGMQSNLEVIVGGVEQYGDDNFVWTGGTTLAFTSAPPATSIRVKYVRSLPIGTSDAGSTAFNGALNYVGQTIGARLLDGGASPRSLGAVGDGVADDTAFVVAALLYSKTLDCRNRFFKISSTTTLPGALSIDARGGGFVAATGATPLFQFIGANAGLYMLGGTVTGTASCFLFCQGSTNTPTLFSHYASLIHLEGVRVNSATITTALVFDRAVNTVNLHGCNFFTPNGINASGANIAVMISNSIIYSATGVAGTFGIKLRSTGGTTFFNQGWQIVNSTIDNFEISHDISDVFAYEITGGYHGCNATLSPTTGYAVLIQAPTNSNLTDTITVGGGTVFAGRTRFVGSAGGQAYNAVIDALWTGVPGTAVALENNVANVTIKGRFKAGTGTAIAVVGSSNNPGIVTDIDVDLTYQNGVVLNGTLGANCVISARGPSTGDIVGAGRANIRYDNIPVHSAGVAALKQAFSATNLGGGATYALAAVISTQAVGCARGETGDIVVHLPYSGANAATQNVQITPPAGMVLAGGTGWSAGNLFLGAAAGLLSVRIPYYCTADVSGSVVIANQAGNTLTVANQAYCGILRNQ